VEFKRGHITHLQDSPEGAKLIVDGLEFSGKWAFDSRFRPADLTPEPRRHHYLKMVFRGLEVEAAGEIFTPQTAILMDFCTPQNNDVRFFYVLPFTKRRALVEYTLFTSQPVTAEACQTALKDYLRTAFRLEIEKDCQVSPREGGSLLITDQPFPRRLGRHVLATGLHGGRLKPTTGYAFTRIQRDSEAILRSMIRSGHPFDLPDAPPLYPQLDSIMLEVMARHPGRIPGIFTALFKNNSLERVARFLNEDASLEEIGQLIATLPPGLFLQILARRSVSPLAFLRTLASA
jgi:lycopene beta-cyclase